MHDKRKQHDQIVKDLERRLKGFEPEALIKPFMIIPNGEIDLFMLLGEAVHNYEAKCSRHQKSEDKGFEQLESERDFFLSQGIKAVRSYFVYGIGGWSYQVDEVTQFHPPNLKPLVQYKIGRGL